MAFSGGTFSRTFDCTTDRDNGVKILASKFDTELDGMAVGLSTAILKDGTQTCTAAIPFQQGITLPDDKTIAFGTNSDVLIQYDETTTDSLKISAAEGAGLAITLMADEGDDAGDEWKLNIADGGTLTLGNDINSAGTYVTHLTITPNATVANSTMAVAGNLTVGGALTLGSGAVISEAELETIDGITPGTVLASKAMVVDADKDITGGRNITISGELDAATLDISGNADIDGTLEADAMTLNGTAITATATLDTGISNNNVPKFTSGAADNDFLRIDGTAIEGRSAAEVLSDIAAAPAAGSSNIVTTGALNSGSITSGFGSIDNGSSAITTTGTVTAGGVNIGTASDTGENNIQISNNSVTSFLGVEGSSGNRFIGSSTNNAFFGTTGADGLEFATNNNVRMKIDSSGSVGIGTTSPATATGGGIDIERAAGASVRIEDTTNSVTGELQIFSAGMNLATATNHNIIISPNNSEIARFTTDGLTFNGDTAAANALDDYEEGTWTPAVSTASATASATGLYTKIGNVVSIQCEIKFTQSGTTFGQISGLPFTPATVTRTPLAFREWFSTGVALFGNLVVGSLSTSGFFNSANSSTAVNGQQYGFALQAVYRT
tara:strand:- start:594 stop:2426 length:1833 start_codon:yes stop_codon:yes gene_type:complete